MVASHPPIHLNIWRSLGLRNVVELTNVLELPTLKEYNERIKNCSERGEEMVQCWDAKLSTNDDCCGRCRNVNIRASIRHPWYSDYNPTERGEKIFYYRTKPNLKPEETQCAAYVRVLSSATDATVIVIISTIVHSVLTSDLPDWRPFQPSGTSNVTRLLRGPLNIPQMLVPAAENFPWLVKRLLHNFPGWAPTWS